MRGQGPLRQRRPPKGTRDQAARQKVTSYRDPPPRGQNDRRVKTLPCPKLRLRAVIICS